MHGELSESEAAAAFHNRSRLVYAAGLLDDDETACCLVHSQAQQVRKTCCALGQLHLSICPIELKLEVPHRQPRKALIEYNTQ